MFRAKLIFSKDGLAVATLLFLTIIWMVTFLAHLDPLKFPDSKTYLQLAENIRNWNWTDFHFRTPGYPLFLAIVQSIVQSEKIMVPAIVQVLLTACIPMFLYGIFRVATASVLLGFLASLVFFLDWSGQLMSVAILTETVSQFLLLASVLLAVLLIKSPGLKKSIGLAVLIFALIMVRPAFLPLGIAFGCILSFVYWWANTLTKAHFTNVLVILALPLLLTALWGLEVRRETGKYAMSHITGIALINQVTDLIPAVRYFEDQELLIFLQKKVASGEGLNAGWDIIKERGKRQDSLEWETALELKKLSVSLILQHPSAYVQKVIRNCREFWVESATYVFTPSKTYAWLRESRLGGSLISWTNANYWQRPGRILFSLLLASLLTIVHLVLPRVSVETKACTMIFFSSIFICMITHVAVNGADLARYRMPIQTLFLAYIVYLICEVLRGMIGIIALNYKSRNNVQNI